MEFFSEIQSFWTVIAFITFIGIVIWAYSKRRRKSFDEAANLPFAQPSRATAPQPPPRGEGVGL